MNNNYFSKEDYFTMKSNKFDKSDDGIPFINQKNLFGEVDSFSQTKGEPKGIVVKVRNNNINEALKELKKKMIQEGILKELKKRERYITGTERNKIRKFEAKLRWQRKLKLLKLMGRV